MHAQERDYLTERRELSLGHDPDLIARYLAGEDLSEELREMGRGEPPTVQPAAQPPAPKKTLKPAIRLIDKPKPVINKPVPVRVHQTGPCPPHRSTRNSPRWSLIAAGLALAVFAISVWIAIG